MSHSYSQNIVLLVFSTKGRLKTISPALQPKLWAYIAGICKNEGVFVDAIGGIEDHVHLLVQIPPTTNLARTILTIKSNSSRWVRQSAQSFAWQQGYAAFSVSASLRPTVIQYIRDQKAHHRKMTFEEEFLALLRKHGVEFDPQFALG